MNVVKTYIIGYAAQDVQINLCSTHLAERKEKIAGTDGIGEVSLIATTSASCDDCLIAEGKQSECFMLEERFFEDFAE